MGPEKVLLVVSVLWLFLPTKLRHPIHLSISIYISTKQRNRFHLSSHKGSTQSVPRSLSAIDLLQQLRHTDLICARRSLIAGGLLGGRKKRPQGVNGVAFEMEIEKLGTWEVGRRWRKCLTIEMQWLVVLESEFQWLHAAGQSSLVGSVLVCLLAGSDGLCLAFLLGLLERCWWCYVLVVDMSDMIPLGQSLEAQSRALISIENTWKATFSPPDHLRSLLI